MLDRNASMFVAGHRGLVGSAVCRAFEARGFRNLLTRTRAELDLLDGHAVDAYFAAATPRYVILAAAKVGGILANDRYPADFLGENLTIQTNVIDAAVRHGTEKLCFLGSSCIYPRLAPQPIPESALLTGPLEKTNEWYAIAKIAGIRLCQAHALQHGFNAISVMPSNLYGPGDNFDLETSHVLPALIRKFHEAKRNRAAEVVVWGSGSPRREFLHVHDLADAICFLMDRYDSPDIINIGVGDDVSIAELAETIRDVVGFDGTIVYDREKPDGTPRKLLDVSRMRTLGWSPEIPLRRGIEGTYAWYLEHVADGDG
jgi:GDP-L-fucose synthase